MLDENVEAQGHDFFALGAASVSLDANLLAYSVDVKGDERYTLRFKDLRTGERYPDEITDIGAGATWAADNRTVYYSTVDEAWRPDTVWRYRLGSGGSSEQVYHEPDERFWLGVGRTRSNAYVLIAAGSSVTSEVRYADAADPDAEFTVVLPRREGVEYSVEHARIGGQERFLILHNDGAVNFTLGGGSGRRSDAATHAHRPPRRRPPRRRRRLRRPPGGQLSSRGAPTNPAVAVRF